MSEPQLWRCVLDDRSVDATERLLRSSPDLVHLRHDSWLGLPGEKDEKLFFVHPTALHCAVINGHVKLAQLLIQFGSSVNAPTDATTVTEGKKTHHYGKITKGDTPLHIAARSGKEELVKLLLASGADHRIRNSAGKRPSEVVAKVDACVAALKEATDPVWRGSSEEEFIKLQAEQTKGAAKLATLKESSAKQQRRFEELRAEIHELQKMQKLLKSSQRVITALQQSIVAVGGTIQHKEKKILKLRAELRELEAKNAGDSAEEDENDDDGVDDEEEEEQDEDEDGEEEDGDDEDDDDDDDDE